ncbi:MAG TPA: hypothetical protein VM782_04655 [Stellaceae bacterium]|nr:hypothetical protein [Stellaceae bacterium]
MTDAPRDGAGPGDGHRPPEEMRLRGRRSPVTRLSRKVLIGLGIAAATGVAGALFVALEPPRSATNSELYNTGQRTTPDGLANLPHDYTGLPKNVPQLGPPLPGDLGRPIVNAGAPAPGMPAGADPEQQRLAQEQEAARTSKLFATSNIQPVSETTSAPAQATPAVASSTSGEPTSSDHKLAFLNAAIDR